MKKITEEIIAFRDERGWGKYHTLRNLAVSISIEAAELLENFQWDDDYDHENACDELADIMIYAISACSSLGEDPEDMIRRKLVKNAEKYPAGEGNK